MTARTWQQRPRATVGGWCWHGGREPGHVTAYRETTRDPVGRLTVAAVILAGPVAASHLTWSADQYPGTVAEVEYRTAARMAPAVALALGWART